MTSGRGAERGGSAVGTPAAGYPDAERDAVYRVIRERRDIRQGFRPDPIPAGTLTRILAAAHTAPSVGLSKPWDFVLVTSAQQRAALQDIVSRCQDAYARSVPRGRAAAFAGLRIDAVARTPLTIAVTCDSTRGGWYTLGAPAENPVHSIGYAVENLWLAARAEGVGLCLVGAYDPAEVARLLGVPDHVEVVALLCLGFVDEFPSAPGLVSSAWARGRPLEWAVHHGQFGQRGLPDQPPVRVIDDALATIAALDNGATGGAQEWTSSTTPQDHLARLRDLTGTATPLLTPAVLILFAGDRGTSGAATAATVRAVLAGGTSANRLAELAGAETCVVDVGLTEVMTPTPGLLPRRPPRAGGRTSLDDVAHAVEVGIETARDFYAAGNRCFAGEVITGRAGHAAAAGIVDAMAAGRAAGPAEVLAATDSLEVAALAGFVVGARALRTPVFLTGATGTAAGAVASALTPSAGAACLLTGTGDAPGLAARGIRMVSDILAGRHHEPT